MLRALALTLLATAWLCAQDAAGVIRGSVRDAITKAPLAGVELSLTGPSSATTATEASGAFQFGKLPSGEFGLSTRKPGYLDNSHGRPSDRIRLDSASANESRTIDLVPLSEVEGRIVDEENKPVSGVMVHGGLFVASNLLSISDADGRYHLENLGPGDYKITFRVPLEMRRKTLKRDPTSGETFGYAVKEYYPGVDDVSLSTPLTLAPGVRLQNVEIRLRRTRLVSLNGRATDTAGPGAFSGEVELVGQGSAYLDDTFRRRPVGAQGAFQFDLIQPGRYRLELFRSHEEEALAFMVQVEVGKAGLEDLRVSVPPFQTIHGSAKLRNSTSAWSGSLSVILVGSPWGTRGKPVPVSADGSFTIEGVPPGQWRMEWRADHLVQANRTLHVAKARFGEQDALWGPVTITESGNPPIEVTLSDESGRLAGTVTDDSKPAARAMIILRRTDGEPSLSQMTTPAIAKPDGSYLFDDLMPGVYEASAWIPDSSGSVALRAERCGNRLVKVKIAAGETSIAALEVCK